MVDAARSMLDELMGKSRNAAGLDPAKEKLRYDDDEVCKLALAGLCPYQLFNNTRSDLGPCDKDVHEGHIEFDRVQKEYEELPQSEKDRLGYEYDLYKLLKDRVSEMDRKIERQRERVAEDNQPRPIKPADQARLDQLKEQEKECIERSEALAMEGDADGSHDMAEAAEKFKQQHDDLHTELVTPERIMSVCEVCGVLVNSTDSEQRRLDHVNGKQYVGWSKIREKLKELEPKFAHSRGPPHGHDMHPPGRSPDRDYGRRDRENGRPYGDRDRDRYQGRDRYDDRRGGDRGRYGDRHSRERGYDRDRGGYERYERRDRYGGDRRDRDRRSYERDARRY